MRKECIRVNFLNVQTNGGLTLGLTYGDPQDSLYCYFGYLSQTGGGQEREGSSSAFCKGDLLPGHQSIYPNFRAHV